MNYNKEEERVAQLEILEEAVLVDEVFSSKEEVLKRLTDVLYKNHIVKDTYFSSLIKRENQSPTGLETYATGIAIPHSEPEHVIKDTVGVAVLDEPIKFYDMVNPKKEIDVSVIFLLVFTHGSKHLNYLQKIMEFLKKEHSLTGFKGKSAKDIKLILEEVLNQPALKK